MSEENVETIRAFYEVYNRRDFDHLPKPLHPDIQVVPSGDQAPIKGAARVRAGTRQARPSRGSGPGRRASKRPSPYRR